MSTDSTAFTGSPQLALN